MYNSKVQDPSVTDNDQIKDHLRWQFVVSFFIENLYVFMDFIVELTHVQNQMFIVESNMRQHFYLEWLLWVLSTNLCILETLNFLNWGILLSSYYQLPNMYCIRMREESAVFKFIYREFSTKWHTCIYCDSICHSFNENLDWNTNCETFIYNIKPRTTSNKHLFLSVLSIYLLCSVWFSMLCRLREIQCSMSDKLFAVDFLLASLCYQTSRWNSLCNNGNKRKVRWMSPDLANERSI